MASGVLLLLPQGYIQHAEPLVNGYDICSHMSVNHSRQSFNALTTLEVVVELVPIMVDLRPAHVDTSCSADDWFCVHYECTFGRWSQMTAMALVKMVVTSGTLLLPPHSQSMHN